MTCPVYTCTVAYTGQVTLYKVPETHGHVCLVGLYITRHAIYNEEVTHNLNSWIVVIYIRQWVAGWAQDKQCRVHIFHAFCPCAAEPAVFQHSSFTNSWGMKSIKEQEINFYAKATLYSHWLYWPCNCWERLRVQYCPDVESVTVDWAYTVF